MDIINRFMALFGYQLFFHKGNRLRLLPLEEHKGKGSAKRPAPVDIRALGNDPRSRGYYSRPVLVEARLDHGRSGNAVAVNAPENPSPLVQASRLAVRNASREDLEALLEQIHHEEKSTKRTELLGLTAQQAPLLADLADSPFSASLRPWDERTLEDFRHKRLRKKEKRKRIENGESMAQWAARHAERIESLLASIREHGLMRHDGPGGDVEGIALIGSDGSWRWQVTKGNHRVAVFSAMGHERIPVRINRVIRREEVHLWPNVVSGLFPEKAALQLFDRLFEGRGFQ